MLETASDRLSERGGPHFGSPDKRPAVRLETIRLAGELRIPFTTGILIGIGETRDGADRGAARDPRPPRALRPHPGGDRPELPRQAGHEDGRRAGAVARGAALDGGGGAARARRRDERPGAAEPLLRRLPAAARRRHQRLGRRLARHDRPRQSRGAVARDRAARDGDARAGLELAPRLPVYPEYVDGAWLDPAVHAARAARFRFGRASRARANGRRATTWPIPFVPRDALPVDSRDELGEEEIVRLFRARGAERDRVFAAADRLRRDVNGDTVTYVVTRNIQYTNVCYFRCGFCAFSKGKLARISAGRPTSCRTTRSCGAPKRHGSAAPSRSVSRAASTRHSTATTTCRSCARSRTPCRASTCTRSRRSSCGRARPRSASRSTSTSRGCRTKVSPRCRAPQRRCSTTRCGASSAPTR